MNTLIEVVINIGESILICYLLGHLLTVREHSLVKRGLGAIAITLWSSCLNLLGIGSSWSVVMTMSANVLFAFFCFKGSRTEKLISGCAYTLIAMISEKITFSFIAPVEFEDISVLMVPGTPRYIMMGIYLMICMGLVVVLGRVRRRKLSLPLRFQMVLIPLVGCGAVALERLMDLIIAIDSGVVPQNAAKIADFICLLIIVILLTMLFLMESLGNVYQQNNELLERQRMEQYEQKEYEIMKNSIMALRSYKHDYKNQLLTMQSLLIQKKYLELEEYIEELSGSMIENMWVNSGNSALDAVVSAKRMEAEDKGIYFHSELYGADKLELKMSDLTSILGNLLDNSIEACTRLTRVEEAKIDLSIKPRGQMVCIKIKNSSDGIYQHGKKGLRTRKREAGHGIGLGRVTEIVEREGGFCKYYPEPDCFTAVIMLPGIEKS